MYTKEKKQPFDLFLLETAVWKGPAVHQVFELAYVISGTGKALINGNTHDYSDGKIFLLSPQDKYSFELQCKTHFLFIRFNDLSFSQFKNEVEALEFCDWTKKAQYLFNNLHAKAGCVYRNPDDEQFGKALLSAIIREYQQKEAGYLLVIRQSVSTLVNILARNISLTEPPKLRRKTPKNDIIQIVAYLQQYIAEPERLRIKAIANHFNFSPNYLGELFRERTGESIQEYVIYYRLKLVETRLAHSNMRISEIAEELNFTDESYLSRLFKKHRGITPGAYRKQLTKSL
jgi:AraC-like DNA-binding protein